MGKTAVYTSTDEIRFSNILKFIIPTYLTSLFNTLYTIVDGIFVSCYVGTDALAAINIVYPIVNILMGIALAFAVGGSAVAALMIGACHNIDANHTFSASMICALLLGGLTTVGIGLNLDGVLHFLGAAESTLPYCRIYAFWWLIGTPAVIAKELLVSFIRVDGSPRYSFFVALTGGGSNILLDYILISRMKMGITGASIATIIGILLSCCMGIFYFITRHNVLQFNVCRSPFSLGLRCALNGASEFVNQLAVAITTIVFNRAAMVFAGDDGVAAVSIIMYLQFLVIGVYYGFSMGLSPLLGYAYGDQHLDVCRLLEKYAYRFIAIASVLLYFVTFTFAPAGVRFFAPDSSPVYPMAVNGLRIYGVGFLFAGANIFSAVRFLTYEKGGLSGIITFLRSFALLLLFLTVLPGYFALAGIWMAVPAAEACTLAVSIPMTVSDARKEKCQKQLV